MTIDGLVTTAACLVIVAAALNDIAARIIPNTLCAVLAALALGLHIARGDGLAAVTAAACVFCATYILWRCRLIGGGDAKLMTAAALLVPPFAVPALVLAITIAGGALGVSYLVLARVFRRRPSLGAGLRPAPLLRRVIRVERWRISRKSSLPYGCAIAAGTFIVLLNGS